MKSLYRRNMTKLVLCVVVATVLLLPSWGRCLSLKDVYIPQPLIDYLSESGQLGHRWIPLNIPGNYCGPGALLKVVKEGKNYGITPLGKITVCYEEADRKKLFEIITSYVPAATIVTNKIFEIKPDLVLNIFGFKLEAGAEFKRVRKVDLQIKEASIDSFNIFALNIWERKNPGKFDKVCCEQLYGRENVFIVQR